MLSSIGSLMVVAACAASAQAAFDSVFNATSLFYTDRVTNFNIENFENLVDVPGEGKTPGYIDIGDRLRGVFRITYSYASGVNFRQPVGFEVTGIFDVLVIGKTDPGSDGNFNFLFGPSGVLDSYAAGTMLAIFSDTTPDFDASLATTALVETTATDGSLFMALGAASGDTWGTDYYWAAVGPDTPAGNLHSSTLYGASLRLLVNNTGFDNSNILLLNQAAPSGWDHPGITSLTLFGVYNPFVMKGSIEYDTHNEYPAYDLKSKDPAKMMVTPEPSSLVALCALGVSLLAAFCVRHRWVR